ncbi:hypothetical protein GCM10027404_19790 [Arthrobacter tumbae]|nr:hypothetical protein [Arthrobacter tumbae]
MVSPVSVLRFHYGEQTLENPWDAGQEKISVLITSPPLGARVSVEERGSALSSPDR